MLFQFDLKLFIPNRYSLRFCYKPKIHYLHKPTPNIKNVPNVLHLFAEMLILTMAIITITSGRNATVSHTQKISHNFQYPFSTNVPLIIKY